MTTVSGSVTVGIDIGTTAVKAVAADATGTVLARARIPHRLLAPAPDRLEHDAAQAWRRGPRRALAQVAEGLDVAGVCVASMVPSLTTVDSGGIPRGPGLLYGDARGREVAAVDADGSPSVAGPVDSAMPDAVGFVRWAARQEPGASGYWPAQAVANHAIGRIPAIDTGMAMCMGALRTGNRWDDAVMASVGVTERQLPVVVPMGEAAGTIDAARSPAAGAVLAGGTVDALCDQIVSGAEEAGDVLVICGATLIVWAVVDDWVEAPGLWTLPHTVAGKSLVGGPSNAGALFVDWARALLQGPGVRRRPARLPAGGSGSEPERPGDPGRVPVWTPYLRGERAPFHDTSLRAGLHDLDITHDAQAVERAAYEASGFVIRHMLDRAGVTARRIVASGGGTNVVPWMQAIADASGLPVDTVAVPEGAALGAAYVARWTAGLESSLDGAGRWARRGRRVEPEPRWQAAAAERYRRFRALEPCP
jgi:xylulokinase